MDRGLGFSTALRYYRLPFLVAVPRRYVLVSTILKVQYFLVRYVRCIELVYAQRPGTLERW